MSDVNGKVVAITGASSGMGEAAALLLARRGAKVVLGARRVDRLEALAGRIAKEGGECVFAATDVRRREDLTNLVEAAKARFERLDAFISNAGIAMNSLLDELRVDEWEAMVDVNLKGVLFGIAAALPVFRAQGSGHFVTIASTAAFTARPTMSVYAATKAAVLMVCEGLRQEAGDALRVTVISPGFVRTELADSMPDPEIRGQIKDRMAKIGISPDAIAEAIAYAIGQPADVDVNEIVIRPTAQA